MAYVDELGNLILQIAIPPDADWEDLEALGNGLGDAAREAFWQALDDEETRRRLVDPWKRPFWTD